MHRMLSEKLSASLNALLLLLVCISIPTNAETINKNVADKKIKEAATLFIASIKIDIIAEELSPELQKLTSGLAENLLENHQLKIKYNYIFLNSTNVSLSTITSSESDYIITVGDTILNTLLESKIKQEHPIIALMVSKKSLKKLKLQSKPNIYAIGYQQPISRYYALINALPIENNQTAVLLFEYQLEKKNEYLQASLGFNDIMVNLIGLKRHGTPYHAIRKVALCCKVLLLDQLLPNTDSLKQKALLINAYRHSLIVIGSSERALEGGSMIALYSRPYDIGYQAADLLAAIKQKKAVPLYQEPNDFFIKINRKISKLFGLSALSVGELINKVKIDNTRRKRNRVK